MSGGFRGIQFGRAHILLSLRDTTSRGLTRAERRLNTFGASVARQAVAFTAFSAGFGSLLTGPLREFARIEQLLGRFDAVFGRLRGEGNAFVQELSDDLRRNTFEIQDQLSQFQAVIQGFGFTRERSFELSQDFTTAAQDLIAFDDSITSTQEAIDKLLGGITGANIRGVRSFGADISAAAVTQEALAAGLGRTNDELTQQEKVIIRHRIIMRSLTNAGVTGQAVREVNTLQSVLRQTSDALSVFRFRVGEAVAPFATGFLRGLTQTLDGFSEFIRTNQILVGVFGAVTLALGTFTAGLVATAAATFTLSFTLGQIRRIFSVLIAPIGIVSRVLQGLVQIALNLASRFTSLFASILSAGVFAFQRLLGVATDLVSTFTGLVRIISRFVRVISDPFAAGLAVANAVLATWTAFATLVTGLLGSLGGLATLTGILAASFFTLGPVLVAVGSLVTSVIGSVLGFISAVFGFIAESVPRILEKASQGLFRFSAAVTSGFRVLQDILPQVFSEISAASQNAFNIFEQDARLAFEGIRAAFEAGDLRLAAQILFAFLRVEWLGLMNFFLDQWDRIGPELQGTFRAVFEEIRDAIVDLIVQVKREVQDLLIEVRTSNPLLTDEQAQAIRETLEGARVTREAIAQRFATQTRNAFQNFEARRQRIVQELRDAQDPEALAAARAGRERALDEAVRNFEKLTADAEDLARIQREAAATQTGDPAPPPATAEEISRATTRAIGTFGLGRDTGRLFGGVGQDLATQLLKQNVDEVKSSRQILQEIRDEFPELIAFRFGA